MNMWESLEVTTTQYPDGSWKRVEFLILRLNTINVFKVTNLLSEATEACEWEFHKREDAMAKYLEVR